MKDFLKKVIGKDEKFYELLEASADEAQKSAKSLSKLYAQVGKPDFEQRFQPLHVAGAPKRLGERRSGARQAQLVGEGFGGMVQIREVVLPALNRAAGRRRVPDAWPAQPMSIPAIWQQIIGIDFGYDHPFAACRLAWDRDNDVIYVTGDYRSRQSTPVFQAAAIKPWGDWIPVAWPHDGFQHDKGSGDQLASLYKAQGLKMLHEHATWPDGGNGVEAGIAEMLDRMLTGRWKVFSTCKEWLEERRLYHRKDGKIVKERDDAISASRYALMMLRFAKTKPNDKGWAYKAPKVA